MNALNDKLRPLTVYGDKVPQIKDLAQKAGVDSGVILAAGGLVASLITLAIFGATILTLVITVLYPAAKSIQALETDSTDDDKEWLTYWIIFGIFTLLDDFLGFVMNLIPYYFWVRLAFFVFLFAPQTKGSMIIYDKAVKPLLDLYKDDIEGLINEIKGSAGDAIKLAKEEALNKARDPKVFQQAANLAFTAQSELSKATGDS